MKIISPFKDFYDNISKYGIDPNLPYFRKEQSFIIGDINSRLSLRNNKNSTYLDTSFLSTFLRLSHSAPFSEDYCKIRVVYFCNEIFVYFNFLINKQNIDTYNKYEIFDLLKEKKKETRWFFNIKTIKHEINSLYVNDPLFKWIEEKCIELKAPYAVISKYDSFHIEITFNYNNLESLKFFKCVHIWDSYQRIYQYLSNLGDVEKNTISLSDKDRYSMKGFDPKKSFRKRKSS